MANPDILAAVDIGTTKIAVIIAEILDDEDKPKILGVGLAPSLGLKRGVVVNIEKTVQSIINAVEQAETMAGVTIDDVIVGIAGDHIRSVHGRGVVAIQGENSEITEDDKRRVIEAAKAVAMPMDRETIHVIPQEYIVDDQRGIPDPLRMTGTRLEAEVHIVTGAVTSAQNIRRCVERAELNVLDIILQPLASSYAVLNDDEKDLGVTVLDLGGGTTDIAMFFDGSIRHTSIVALGGNSVTNDLALCLRTPVDQAEELKVRYGSAMHTDNDAAEMIEIPGVGGRDVRSVPRSLLIDIVQPRMEEIFNLVSTEIGKSEFSHMMTAGLVLTGGGSMLQGLDKLAEQVFEMPVKLGHPRGMSGLMDMAKSPVYATAIGLILYYLVHQDEYLDPLGSKDEYYGIVSKMKKWFGFN